LNFQWYFKKNNGKTLLQLSLSQESQEAIVIILRNPDAKVEAFQKSQATMIPDTIEKIQVFKVRT
jgi:hypothetical protein